MLRKLTHRLARPHGVVADLDVAVEEDVGVGAADKLEHLDPEQGLGSLAVPQHAQGLLVGQQRAAAGEDKGRFGGGGGGRRGDVKARRYREKLELRGKETLCKHCLSGLVRLSTVAFHCGAVANGTKILPRSSRTCTAVEPKRMWPPLRLESHDQNPLLSRPPRPPRAVVFAVEATNSHISDFNSSSVRLH